MHIPLNWFFSLTAVIGFGLLPMQWGHAQSVRSQANQAEYSQDGYLNSELQRTGWETEILPGEANQQLSQQWSELSQDSDGVSLDEPKRAGIPTGWLSPEVNVGGVIGGDLDLLEMGARVSYRPERLPLLTLTPGIQLTHFNGDFEPDPDTFHEVVDWVGNAQLDATIFLPVSEKWVTIAGVTPSWAFSKDERSASEFRMTGRILGIYQWTHQLKLTIGAVYLNREDISWLPAVGLNYTPYENLVFDLSFPRPQVKYRYDSNAERERWLLAGIQIGGGSWPVYRVSELNRTTTPVRSVSRDTMTYRDLRLTIGCESRLEKQLFWRWEAGFVFARSVEYDSEVGEFDPGSGGFLRGTLTF